MSNFNPKSVRALVRALLPGHELHLAKYNMRSLSTRIAAENRTGELPGKLRAAEVNGRAIIWCEHR